MAHTSLCAIPSLTRHPALTPSFRAEQADAFSSTFGSCERVGLRREKSLLSSFSLRVFLFRNLILSRATYPLALSASSAPSVNPSARLLPRPQTSLFSPTPSPVPIPCTLFLSCASSSLCLCALCVYSFSRVFSSHSTSTRVIPPATTDLLHGPRDTDHGPLSYAPYPFSFLSAPPLLY